MLTKYDLEQVKKIVKTAIKETSSLFASKDDLKGLATKDELKQTVEKLREEIILFKDEILHEIINLRDDVAVILGYRDLIEDHEQRITKLEKTPQIKPTL